MAFVASYSGRTSASVVWAAGDVLVAVVVCTRSGQRVPVMPSGWVPAGESMLVEYEGWSWRQVAIWTRRMESAGSAVVTVDTRGGRDEAFGVFRYSASHVRQVTSYRVQNQRPQWPGTSVVAAGDVVHVGLLYNEAVPTGAITRMSRPGLIVADRVTTGSVGPVGSTGYRTDGVTWTIHLAGVPLVPTPVLASLPSGVDVGVPVTVSWQQIAGQSAYTIRRVTGTSTFFWSGTAWVSADTKVSSSARSAQITLPAGSHVLSVRASVGSADSAWSDGRGVDAASAPAAPSLSVSSWSVRRPTVTVSGSAGAGAAFAGYRIEMHGGQRNLIPNPSFETDLAGWFAAWGVASRQVWSTQFKGGGRTEGNAGALLTSNATGSGSIRLNSNKIALPAGADKVTAAATYWSDSNAGMHSRVSLVFFDAAGTQLAPVQGSPWTYAKFYGGSRSVVVGTPPVGATQVDVRLETYNSGGGAVPNGIRTWWDAVTLEAGITDGSWFADDDGSGEIIETTLDADGVWQPTRLPDGPLSIRAAVAQNGDQLGPWTEVFGIVTIPPVPVPSVTASVQHLTKTIPPNSDHVDGLPGIRLSVTTSLTQGMVEVSRDGHILTAGEISGALEVDDYSPGTDYRVRVGDASRDPIEWSEWVPVVLPEEFSQAGWLVAPQYPELAVKTGQHVYDEAPPNLRAQSDIYIDSDTEHVTYGVAVRARRRVQVSVDSRWKWDRLSALLSSGLLLRMGWCPSIDGTPMPSDLFRVDSFDPKRWVPTRNLDIWRVDFEIIPQDN